MKTVALTGATGFLGAHVLGKLAASDIHVKALTRTAHVSEQMGSVDWISGSLGDHASLITLCSDADTLIHIAGIIKARTEADFIAGNVIGTANIIAAAQAAGIRRMVHISSQTARAPHLSYYAASKAAAERLVEASGLDWTIMRLPSIYGPGDYETLPFFKAATGFVMPLSNPNAPISIIHVFDAASAIIAACQPAMVGICTEISDGQVHSQFALAKAIIHAVAGKPYLLPLPRSAAWLAGVVSELWARLNDTAPMLTRKKVAELYHNDWSVAEQSLTTHTGWMPGIDLASGLKQIVLWYKHQGLMK